MGAPYNGSHTGTGMDSNPNLTHAQKFAYLRAQLEGDTARVTAGFLLTDNNYLPAVTQLQPGVQYNRRTFGSSITRGTTFKHSEQPTVVS